MPPSQQTGGVAPQTAGARGGALSSSVIRSMPDDLRRLSSAPQSVSGSGKVMWPSGSPEVGQTQPSVPVFPQDTPAKSKEGFFSSLLHSRTQSDAPPPVAAQAQRIPVKGEGDAKNSVWDARVPSTLAGNVVVGGRPPSPRSALPIPQRPIVAPPTRAEVPPPASPLPMAPKVAPSQAPIIEEGKRIPSKPIPAPTLVIPPSQQTPPVTPQMKVIPPQPPRMGSVISPVPRPTPVPPAPLPVAPKVTPPVAPAPLPHPVVPPRPSHPLSSPVTPRTITPVSSRSTLAHGDDDIGIDLGLSEYLKGGPTFQIAPGSTPVSHQASLSKPVPKTPIITPVPPTQPSALGGVWNPPKTDTPVAQVSATPVRPTTTPTVQAPPEQHSTPKPTQSNADLDAEKQRLLAERAQTVGSRGAIDESIRTLISEKHAVEEQMKPVLLRETNLAREIDELEKKEQGLVGEVRRAIERDRWTKVEERRRVEQERLLIKRKAIAAESEIHAKEEENVSLVKREKDINARIVWIESEYKRREVRMKLAQVNQEKTSIESHRAILDNSLKRLKASLEESEKNERRLVEQKRALAIKMPQTIAEEERFSQERFDIEKQMHEIEVRRWSLEDELKTATELFTKEDMAYLDVMHRAESLEGELKEIG